MGLVVSFTRLSEQEFTRLVADPASIDSVLDGRVVVRKEPDGYIDKAWAGLNHLFAAAGVPVDLLEAGVELGEDGSLFAWSPRCVRETAAALEAVPFARLAEHYDPPTMERRQVYPNIWVRDGEQALHYLRLHHGTLLRFLRHAAASGSGAVMGLG